MHGGSKDAPPGVARQDGTSASPLSRRHGGNGGKRGNALIDSLEGAGENAALRWGRLDEGTLSGAESATLGGRAVFLFWNRRGAGLKCPHSHPMR